MKNQVTFQILFNSENFLIAPAASSISHIGVEVAPQMPTVSTSFLNQFDFNCSMVEIKYEFSLFSLHTPKRYFPLELFSPLTKIITSFCLANSRKCGALLETAPHKVSFTRNSVLFPVSSIFLSIAFIMLANPSFPLVVCEYNSIGL